MWVEDYQWHYDYVRLAWDTGFSFEKCKSPHLDKNKICVVDVDRIVKERDVASVDRYISTVVQYILDDEQAKVLDTNFVKLFRISQLAVEYLLFCKKYLDNTVVLLKKELSKGREENKELKAFIEDLQVHIETLTKQHTLTTFKCSSCSKVFSSEDYLNAHIKRRHSNQSTVETYNAETDKLNMEIKELKERLNNTEKLLKEHEQSPVRKLSDVNNDNIKLTEILEKFDEFKSHMENELKELRIQKNFYEENYGRLFDIVIQNKENVEPKIPKTETMTQTDKVLQIENISGDQNVLNIKDSTPSHSSNEEPAAQAHKESLEAKISTTLAGIENQMQAFWNKLNDIERGNPNVAFSPVRSKGDQKTCDHSLGEEKSPVREPKPKAKPRSKLTQPTQITSHEATNNAEKLKVEIEKMEEPMRAPPEILVIQHRNGAGKENKINTDESSSSNSESESDESDTPSVKTTLLPAADIMRRPEKADIKQTVAATEKRSPVKARSTHEALSKKILYKASKEIKQMICGRLQGLGISSNWTSLPEKSFNKVLEIINHQAELSKKTYPNFGTIRSHLNSEVEERCRQKKLGNGSKLKKIQNIVKVSYRPTSGRKKLEKSPKREIIQIKNRALYETDTDSEDNNVKHLHHNMYSSVVKELKSSPHIKPRTDEDSVDDVHKDAQKGVLKNFPSAGSLSKKKVLFDLESDSSRNEDPVAMKAGGSTTSVASSILGEKIDTTTNERMATREKSICNKHEKELDDLSNFDLSDV